MSRTSYGGPKLPKNLLEKVSDGRIGKRIHQQTRKEKRKAERTQKKHVRAFPVKHDAPRPRPATTKAPGRGITTSHSEPKGGEPVAQEVSEDEHQLEDDFADFDDEGASEEDAGESDEDTEDDYPVAPVVSRAVKAKLDDDDAEIRALEKKLGMRGKKSRKVGDDELDWLVSGGMSSEDEDGFAIPKRKRAAPEDDDWLKQKRRKAEKKVVKVPIVKAVEQEEEEESLDESEDLGASDQDEDEDGDDEQIENPFSEDEVSDSDLGVDEDDEDITLAPAKERENPYVAPAVKDAAASAGKYVPPSMRRAASGDEEMLRQLQRQLNGQMNKLSEANMLSILSAVQEIYSKNARGHVTSVLIELFKNRVCDRSVLTDNEMILLAGFASAVYRTTGADFGAQLLEAMVEAFDRYHADKSDEKQTLNILAFLSNCYTLQTIGCEVIFDYVRMLLDNFSEENTELLLRVIRISGQQLRQDDPSALKDIVLLLQRAITKAGGAEKVSVRTKFMIETIHNLKNNRTTAGGAGSVSSIEHTTRMKKTLGQIKSTKTTEPLRISLADIRDSDKKGKWWLVGASWRDPAKMVNSTSEQATQPSIARVEDDDPPSDPDEVDLDALARAQGMNTDVRRAIFISIIGAVDPTHARLRLQKLNLKNKQQLEIPRVLLHCVSAEPLYNHFYALIGLQFCSGHKMAKAWQFALFDVFRRIDADSEEDAEAETAEISIRNIYNIAKLYATMVSEQHLRITILKPLPFMALSVKARIFAEVLITTLLILLRKKHGKEAFGRQVEECFGQAHAVPDMVKGLDWFLESVIAESEIPANKKEKKVVAQGVEYAVEALRDEKRMGVTPMEGNAGEDDSDLG
ncbi:Putative MIF4G-like, type 3, initiation factor eIF-4 gamma, MA3 [Septoria linicola]|uniref:MIF4G-like, type 3, initiation factor eIF-4 gamma, MA3 n=1 Tax=Septoria linicola TaxID=215465 RepID=A0A9Q9EN12_9PEZI|nr:Putative MIF4G-like, type 3, initiation factor eIF-4 gamma, MA3 [Septoria linicola]